MAAGLERETAEAAMRYGDSRGEGEGGKSRFGSVDMG